MSTLLGLSKASSKPTTYYALSLCIHVIALVIMLCGMFTPYWTEITEQIGTGTTDYVYDRGLVLSCLQGEVCQGNVEFSSQSDVFFAAFILGIMSIVFAVFIGQVFIAGVCIRSLRERSLGIPLAVMSIVEGVLLIIVLVLFEISIGYDTSAGNTHRGDTFGVSRWLIIAAVVFYWTSAFFLIGEHVRRSSWERANSDDHHRMSNKQKRSVNGNSNRGKQEPPPYRKQHF